MYPSGSAARVVEERMGQLKDKTSLISEDRIASVVEELINELHERYKKNAAAAALSPPTSETEKH